MAFQKMECPLHISISFFEMPYEILCSIKVPPQMLRKFLEVFRNGGKARSHGNYSGRGINYSASPYT